jgi:hypothetical protein
VLNYLYMTRAAIRSCGSKRVVVSFRSLPSVAGWGSWKRSLSRGKMGCRWLHRSHCPKEQLPAHLLLGSDAVQYTRFAEERRESDAKAWHNISILTDAEDVKELPNLKF